MTNIRLPLEQYRDLEIHNLYARRTAAGYDPAAVMESIYRRGRDNARTPMQWTNGENAGFTEGTPWLPVNENHRFIHAEAALADPDSVFHYYRRLIALRKTYEVFREGKFRLLLPSDPHIFAYLRETQTQTVLVICNFSADTQPLQKVAVPEKSKCLLHNYEDVAEVLRPYEARIYFGENTKKASDL